MADATTVDREGVLRAVFVAFTGLAVYSYFSLHAPPVPDLRRYASVAPAVSRMYAADGTMLGEFLESGLVRKCRILSRLSRERLSKTERKMLVRRLIPRAILLRIRLARSYAALAWSRRE